MQKMWKSADHEKFRPSWAGHCLIKHVLKSLTEDLDRSLLQYLLTLSNEIDSRCT